MIEEILLMFINLIFLIIPALIGLFFGYMWMVPENRAKLENSLFKKNLGILHIIHKGNRMTDHIVGLNGFSATVSNKTYSLDSPQFIKKTVVTEDGRDLFKKEEVKVTYPLDKDKHEYTYYSKNLPHMYCKDDDYRLIVLEPNYIVGKQDPGLVATMFGKQKSLAERAAQTALSTLKLLILVVCGLVVLNIILTFLQGGTATSLSEGIQSTQLICREMLNRTIPMGG